MNNVAVLIPCYNNLNGLNKSLDSLSQAEGEFDIIIVDDGSTPPINIKKEITQCGKEVVIIHLKMNQGIAVALNHGLEYIKRNGYKYIARLDCGDTIKKDRFIKQIDVLKNNPNYGLVGSWVIFKDEVNKKIFQLELPVLSSQIKKYFHRRCVLIHPAVMFRCNIFESMEMYNENYYPAEDYELFFRIIIKYDVYNFPEHLTVCEINSEGISTGKRKKQMIMKLKIQIKYFIFSSEAFLGILLTLAAIVLPYNFIKYLNTTKLGEKLSYQMHS